MEQCHHGRAPWACDVCTPDELAHGPIGSTPGFAVTLMLTRLRDMPTEAIFGPAPRPCAICGDPAGELACESNDCRVIRDCIEEARR